MIRKSGWLIFLVMLAAVLALVYLLAGPVIRIGMAHTLEHAVGAEVNIGDVSVSLAPLALDIHDLQITDPEKPSHNSVSFAAARAALEVWPALLGYYVIDDLSVNGLAYGRERAAPGKVYRGENANSEARFNLAEVLRLDIPNAEELLARLDPQLKPAGEALRALIEQQRQQLKELQSQLPRKEALAAIQAEIKTLTDSKIAGPADLATKAEQLQALQNKLKAERDKIREAQRQLVAIREQLQQAVENVRLAGEADWQKLQELANLSDGGLAPLSEILLGDFWGEKIAQIETLYRFAAPYIPDLGGKGAAAVEPVEPVLPNRILPLPVQPYPDFWIKSARVNWLIGGGEATLNLRDVTAQHHLIGTATRFNLNVENLPKLAAFKLDGDFAVLQQTLTNITWQLDGLKLNEFSLGSGDDALNVADGLLASTGSLKLVDNQINQEAQMLLQQPSITATGNHYMQQLAELLDSQPQIPLKLSAEGLISEPRVSVRSSLDKVVGEALLGEAKVELAKLEQQLRQQVDAQLKQQLGNQGQWLAELDVQDTQLTSIENNIDEMLKAKLASVQSEAKDRIKDALLKRRQDD